MKEIIIKNKNDIINENEFLTKKGILNLERNFGGLDNPSSKIKEIFKKEFGHKNEIDKDFEINFYILDAMKKISNFFIINHYFF